jgi:hypothetical protein
MYKWRVYQPSFGMLDRNRRLETAGFGVITSYTWDGVVPDRYGHTGWYTVVQHNRRGAMTLYLLTVTPGDFASVEEVTDV